MLALDAVNGQRVWHFNPRANLPELHAVACRGVAYGEQHAASGSCAGRIYAVTLDNTLWALDALSGEPCVDFGHAGAVDLLQGLGDVPQGGYIVTSPALVSRDRVVVGAGVEDSSLDIPSGVVRAYDARSGELVWAWDVGRPDRRGARRPGNPIHAARPMCGHRWSRMTRLA